MRKISIYTTIQQEKYKILISAMVAATVLSGDFSLGRIIPGMERSIGEVRILGTLTLIPVAILYWLNFNNKNRNQIWTLVPLSILCIIILIKCWPHFSTERGISYIIDVSIIIADCFIIVACLNNEKTANYFLLWAIVIAGLIFCLNLFNIFYHDFNVSHQFFIGTAITFNRLLLFGSISALVFLCSDNLHTSHKTILCILSSLFLFSALITASKAAFLSGLCACLWLSVWTAVKKQYKTLLLQMLVIVFVYALFFYFNSARLNIWIGDINPSEGLKQAEGLKQDPKNIRIPLNVDKSDRIPMVIEAVKLFRENPIWGAGPNAFYVKKGLSYIKEDPYYRYPHNVVLELLVLGGAVMGSAFLIAVVGPLIPALREIYHNNQVMALSTFMIIILVQSMVGGDLYDSRLFWFVALLIPVFKMRGAK